MKVLLIFFIGFCLSWTSTFAQDNNDVLILATIAQDFFRNTNRRDLNLNEVLKADTLNRVSKSFKSIDTKLKGGYISVYYNFSELRDSNNIVLIDKEKELINKYKWTKKDLSKYDGEIQFDYGERFYHIKKILIVRRPN